MEPVQPVPLDENFDGLMKLLSNLPTDAAMKELSKRRIGSAVIAVVENMAFYKTDLIRIMRHIHIRERCLLMEKEARDKIDQTVNEWIKLNPNYKIEAVPND